MHHLAETILRSTEDVAQLDESDVRARNRRAAGDGIVELTVPPIDRLFLVLGWCQRSRSSGIRRAAAAGNPTAVVTSASLGRVAPTLTRGSEEFFGRRNRASTPSRIAG